MTLTDMEFSGAATLSIDKELQPNLHAMINAQTVLIRRLNALVEAGELHRWDIKAWSIDNEDDDKWWARIVETDTNGDKHVSLYSVKFETDFEEGDYQYAKYHFERYSVSPEAYPSKDTIATL